MRSDPKTARIIVTFRNDDLSSVSDLEHERQVFSLFERSGIPQTIGVIPAVAVPDVFDAGRGETEVLRRDSTVAVFLREYSNRTQSELAQHGFSHRVNRFSATPRVSFSEFARLTLAEQLEKIQKGADILEQALDICPRTFVPPWNSLDGNTVLACSRSGFKAISAGPHLRTQEDLGSYGFNLVLEEAEEALERARNCRDRVFLHVLIHSRLMTDAKEMAQLERFLETLSRDSECAALTVAECCRLFPEDLRLRNEAGRSLVPFAKETGTERGRVSCFLRGIPGLERRSGLAQAQDLARERYLTGDYAGCADLGRVIDRKCRCLLWVCRALILLMGGAWAGILSLIHIDPVLLWGCFAVPLGGSAWLARRAVKPDVRKEVLLGAVLFACGFAGLLLLVSGWHRAGWGIGFLDGVPPRLREMAGFVDD